jgi:hypothetical protein
MSTNEKLTKATRDLQAFHRISILLLVEALEISGALDPNAYAGSLMSFLEGQDPDDTSRDGVNDMVASLLEDVVTMPEALERRQ